MAVHIVSLLLVGHVAFTIMTKSILATLIQQVWASDVCHVELY